VASAPTSLGATELGATQLVSSNAPDRPATAAELARHRSAVRYNDELRRAASRRDAWRAAAWDRWAASRHALIHHDAAVAHNEALRAAAAARHRAAAQAAARRLGEVSRVGVATWYGWYPGQCASPFLPHGTLLTVTDLATHKTIQCLVTDTEAHNPGRVVDLSEYCFEELASLSQGVILVRITW
jgi:rare lipoprotein A (peptidoglycan hydrolase)